MPSAASNEPDDPTNRLAVALPRWQAIHLSVPSGVWVRGHRSPDIGPLRTCPLRPRAYPDWFLREACALRSTGAGQLGSTVEWASLGGLCPRYPGR